MAKYNIRSNDPRLDYGIKNTFSKEASFNARAKTAKTKETRRQIVSNEVQSMLDMSVNCSVKPERGQIMSNIFLREKKVNFRIIIYKDDMLIMEGSLEGTERARDTT